MMRLFKIEWLKLKNYRTFWVVSSLYLFLMTFIPISVLEFMKWLESKGVEFENFSPLLSNHFINSRTLIGINVIRKRYSDETTQNVL